MESGLTQKILISLVHFPLTALGPGRRIGIWTQGCSIRCPGCISRHTWDETEGELMTVERLLERIAPHLGACDGVTISGGEPFDQPEALAALVENLRDQGIEDILVYSGYDHEQLQGRHPETLAQLAALVDGRFMIGNDTEAAWKGSGNQRLFILSHNPELQQRYEVFRSRTGTDKRLQVIGAGGRVMIVGIPRQGDLEAFINGTD